MKISQQIEVKCQCRAQLTEEGELQVIVSATAVYDEKSGAYTVARVEAPEEAQAKIRAAMAEAITACEAALSRKIQDAIATSRQVGQRLGEVVIEK